MELQLAKEDREKREANIAFIRTVIPNFGKDWEEPL